MGIFLLKIFVPILFWSTVLGTADMAIATGEIVGNENGSLFIRARNVSLKTVVDSLQKDFAVDISGLESLENDKITFVFEADSLEELVKGLLRHLSIKNYALEFVDDKLRSVMVVPGAKRIIADPVDSDYDSAKREETVTVAVIKSIVESSQAETLDLMQGDFIVEYDGVRINSAAQLVEEVKNKSAKNQIEMIVVRDKTLRQLILQGGVIGVRITTEKVSNQEYLNYF
jgi:predicted metalloprotease with PDZ domain